MAETDPVALGRLVSTGLGLVIVYVLEPRLQFFFLEFM
jgi:hypothetical protein